MQPSPVPTFRESCERGLAMDMIIRKIGHSQGMLFPRPILASVGLEGAADLPVRDGVIGVRPLRRNPREGRAAGARRLAELQDDAPAWPELPHAGDDGMVW